MSTPVADSERTARHPLRSVGAVLAGLVVIFVLSTGMDQIFHVLGVYPPWDEPMSTGQYILALAYRIPIAILGCYLAARLAPSRPMLHALILGAIGVVLSTAGAAAMWHLGDHWYPITLILVALPSAWAGGALYLRTRS